MPKYCYYCESCKAEFEVDHSIKEKLEKCELCEADNALKRLPFLSAILTKNKLGIEKKVGSLVEKHIEENREILEKERERLKKVEY